MATHKFTYKECCCDQYDSICSCYENAKYEYLKQELQKLIEQRYGGDDTREAIKELLAEVEKPYEDAKISNTPALDAKIHK